MNRLPILFVLCLALAILATLFVQPNPVLAQSPNTCVYVREPSHNIHGAFFAFYEANGGAARFGVPLTEAFLEDEKVVQYFTYARLEFVPQNPEPYRVQLGLLGMQYNITDPPIKSAAVPSLNDPNFRYFPETGLMIGFAIKEFYDANGGRDLFGYPVSQLRYENGMFVQYFQRARVEWNPIDPGSNKVRLSPAGQVALDRRYPADFPWRARAASDWCVEASVPYPVRRVATLQVVPTPTPGLSLDVQVRVRFRQTGTKGPQFVDVVVDDRATTKPVPGVALYAVIQYPRGARVIPLMPTDANGQSAFSFDIGVQPAGSSTVVTVYAFLGSSAASGSTSFTHQ
ncbi:MAG: hypothetical protein HY868_17630 [Chloroflexi bacterium]|nr:hypothetical protein [Chloroflexota bacterium]